MTWGDSEPPDGLNPSRAAFVDKASSDTPVVVRATAELPSALTPLAAYAAVTGRTADVASDRTHTFLLESAAKAESSDPAGEFDRDGAGSQARFSFIGYDPDAVITVDDGESTVRSVRETAAADLVDVVEGDVLGRLRGALPDAEPVDFPPAESQQLDGGLVGFLAYNAVYDLWLEDVGVERPDSRFPDAQFVLTTRTVVFDHREDTVSLVFTPVVRPEDDPDAVYDDLLAETDRVRSLLRSAGSPDLRGFTRYQGRERAGPREDYEAAVRRAKEHVLDGDIYQGVISRTRELEGEIDPLGLYASLREVNPSPYMYLLGFDDLSIVGASPETLVTVRGEDGRREVVANPIAGTCPRGTDPADGPPDLVEDRRLAGEMLADEKERAEHTMLVDLARNDLRRVCESGTIDLAEFMNVLKYSHVQHIESTVTGRLAPEYDAFDAVRATFPAGTLSGAPKIRAMEIIDDLELQPRGVYGGGVGYVSWTGRADFAIVIRTAVVESGDPDRITVQAGAGIVADSDPAREYTETENKMNGVLEALERIETVVPEEEVTPSDD